MTVTPRTRGAVSRAVLVTGCSSGMGRAIAVRLARDGWPVFATARKPELLADLQRAGCNVMRLDVTDESSMRAAVEAIEAVHGAVGVLVNNAGYSQAGAVEALPIARARAQFETNVFGPARLSQFVLAGMRRQGWGRIVNVSSMGGKLVLPGAGYYHATKFALEAVSDALRFEVEHFGIDVVVIEPGLIRSAFAKTASSNLVVEPAADDPYKHFHAEVSRITTESYVKGPLARLTGSPEDVAHVVARALSARRPRTRYTVAPSATFLLTLRRILPDRLWDRFLARTYPRPS